VNKVAIPKKFMRSKLFLSSFQAFDLLEKLTKIKASIS
jgi:hypothetical protein